MGGHDGRKTLRPNPPSKRVKLWSGSLFRYGTEIFIFIFSLSYKCLKYVVETLLFKTIKSLFLVSITIMTKTPYDERKFYPPLRFTVSLQFFSVLHEKTLGRGPTSGVAEG